MLNTDSHRCGGGQYGSHGSLRRVWTEKDAGIPEEQRGGEHTRHEGLNSTLRIKTSTETVTWTAGSHR